MMGTSISKVGIPGMFSGGTEFTPQLNRFAHEELLDGTYFAPTYGNTLMGLAASTPPARTTTTRSSTTRRNRGRWSRWSIGRSDTSRRVRSDGTREADDADEGVFHARLPRARRGGARAALRSVPVGRRQRRSPVLAAWPRPRRLACTETRGAFRESAASFQLPERALEAGSRKLGATRQCFTYPFSVGASPTPAWKWTRSSISPRANPSPKSAVPTAA